ncbi:MAG: hypothetical protein ABSF03_31635 [Streptosporangiaceae bacterium]|jgi:hypothetical protein
MRTDVRIERVILEGLELSRRERDALGPAIARELRRLAGEPANGPADRRAEDRRRGPGPAVDGIAREIAAAVHRATAAAQPAAGPAARPGARRERR